MFTTIPQIIYVAIASVMLNITLFNTNSIPVSVNLQSSLTVYANGSIAAGATSVYSIPLDSLASIVAYAGNTGVQYSMNINGVPVSFVAINDTALTNIERIAQGAVGVKLTSLTQAQISALNAVLLYQANGVDPVTLKVKPFSYWVH